MNVLKNIRIIHNAHVAIGNFLAVSLILPITDTLSDLSIKLNQVKDDPIWLDWSGRSICDLFKTLFDFKKKEIKTVLF